MPLAAAPKSSTAFSRDPDRGGTCDIGIEARLIVEHADPDRAAAIFRMDGARARSRRQDDEKPSPPLAHDNPPSFQGGATFSVHRSL